MMDTAEAEMVLTALATEPLTWQRIHTQVWHARGTIQDGGYTIGSKGPKQSGTGKRCFDCSFMSRSVVYNRHNEDKPNENQFASLEQAQKACERHNVSGQWE